MTTYFRDSNAALAYPYLTDEEMQRIQIVAADDSEVVIYKPKRHSRSSGKTAKSKAASMRPTETNDLEQASSTQQKSKRHKSKTTTSVSVHPMETYDLEQASSTKRDFGVQEKPKRHKPKKTRSSLTQPMDADGLEPKDFEVQEKPKHRGSRSFAQTKVRSFAKTKVASFVKSKVASVLLMQSDDQEQASAPRNLRDKIDLSASARTSTTAQSSQPSQQRDSAPRSLFDNMSYRTRSAVKEMMRFKAIKITQVLFACYILFLTFADIGPPGGLRDTETGLIIDQASPERTERGLILINGTERAVVGATLFQVASVGIARASAWIMYPGK
jgi:hypothetical protein